MGIETALIATLALGAGAAGYSAYESREQRKDVEEDAKKRELAAAKLKKDEKRNERQALMRLQRRRGAAGEGAGQPRETILTGSQGVNASTGGAPVGKSLLGL